MAKHGSHFISGVSSSKGASEEEGERKENKNKSEKLKKHQSQVKYALNHSLICQSHIHSAQLLLLTLQLMFMFTRSTVCMYINIYICGNDSFPERNNRKRWWCLVNSQSTIKFKTLHWNPWGKITMRQLPLKIFLKPSSWIYSCKWTTNQKSSLS